MMTAVIPGCISDLIEVTVADPRIAIPASLISPTVAPRSAASVASGTPPIPANYNADLGSMKRMDIGLKN